MLEDARFSRVCIFSPPCYINGDVAVLYNIPDKDDIEKPYNCLRAFAQPMLRELNVEPKTGEDAFHCKYAVTFCLIVFYK